MLGQNALKCCVACFLLVAVMQTAGYAQSSGQAGNLVREWKL